jgi:sporulation protein YunB
MAPKRKRRKRGSGRLLLLLGGLLCLGIAAVVVIDLRLRPVMLALASSQLQNEMTLKTAEIWNDLEVEQGFSLAQAVQLHQLEDGTVVAVTTDADKMNLLSAALTTELAVELEKMEREQLSVPLGTALSLPLLSGLGPTLSAEVIDVGHANAEVVSNLSEAGINQTVYSVSLQLEVELLLLLPGGTEQVTVRNVVPLAETVLVGDVPTQYITIEQGAHSASDSLAEENGENLP